MTASAVCATRDCFFLCRYTGKERDTESGNDYFGARYYASSMGRWLSPDWSVKVYPVPYAKLDNPQTLNLYAYVGNNPLNRFDPDGHYSCDTKNHAGECGKIKDALAIVKKADSNLKEGSKERGRLDAVLKFYGSENDGKGPSVQFADLSKDNAVGETQTVNGKTTITFDTKALGNFGEAGKGKRSFMRERTAWMTTLIGVQSRTHFGSFMITSTAPTKASLMSIRGSEYEQNRMVIALSGLLECHTESMCRI